MTSDRDIIRKLNEIRASEQRMALLYRRCAEMVTGPSRDSLAEVFTRHAKDEDQHAAHAQRHIMALDGDLDVDVKPLPVWHGLDEILAGIEDYEEKGVRLWQELLEMLPHDDAFRHTVEEILSTEQEHWDDARRWRRTDYAEKAMKTHGDHGAPIPLNWRNPSLYIGAPVTKSESHAEQIERASRAGTPPTRRGMFHGVMPATQPGVPAELNPPLVLKAVRDPGMAGSGTGDSAERKRDPASGKFAPAQQAGAASTAEEDVAAQERATHLAQRRYGIKALGVPEVPLQPQQPPMLARPKPPPQQNPMSQAGIPASPPGMSRPFGGPPASGQQTPQQQPPNPMAQGQQQPPAPMATAPDGTPIFDDPFHPAHSAFTPDHHQFAQQAHQQEAERATAAGRIPTALDHQLKAQIHGDLAGDAKSPMERVAGNAGGRNTPSNDALDQFFQMMPDKNPKTAPANGMGGQPPQATGATGAMGGQLPDQAKPDFGMPTGQGPKPRMFDTRTQSPIGPQSQSAQHAGTVSQPQGMPPSPPSGNGSMPDIRGPSAIDPAVFDPSDENATDATPEEEAKLLGGERTAGGGKQPGLGGIGGPMGATASPAGGGMPGLGAQQAPPTHAGSATMPVPSPNQPAPADMGGATAPPPQAGPATMDKTPSSKREASAESSPFGGSPTEDKAREPRESPPAIKSIMDWFSTI